MSQVGGTNAIWTMRAALSGIKMSPSATTLEVVCCPIHYSMAHVNSGGAVNRQ